MGGVLCGVEAGGWGGGGLYEGDRRKGVYYVRVTGGGAQLIGWAPPPTPADCLPPCSGGCNQEAILILISMADSQAARTWNSSFYFPLLAMARRNRWFSAPTLLLIGIPATILTFILPPYCKFNIDISFIYKEIFIFLYKMSHFWFTITQ